MDIRKVKKLIELLEESNIDELEIKEGVGAHQPQRRQNDRPGPPVLPLPLRQPRLLLPPSPPPRNRKSTAT